MLPFLQVQHFSFEMKHFKNSCQQRIWEVGVFGLISFFFFGILMNAILNTYTSACSTAANAVKVTSASAVKANG